MAASPRWASARASPPPAARGSADLAPGARGLGQLARQLGAVGVGLERLDAPLLRRRPPAKLERLARRRGRRRGSACSARDSAAARSSASRARASSRAPSQCVATSQLLAPGRLERLGQPAVQRAAPQPRDVGVERLAGEGVAERARGRVRPRDQPLSIELSRPPRRSTASRRASRSNALAGDRGGLGGRPCLLATARRRRPARRRGSCPATGPRRRGQLEPAAARRSAPVRAAPASSSTKNGTPWVRSWIARASEGAGARVRAASASRLAVSSGSSGESDDLVEAAGAAQLVAQPAQQVVARQAVGAVGRDDEQRHLAQRLGQGREQLERRVVGPLQVVEHDDSGPFAGQVRRSAQRDRLEQRGAGRRPARGLARARAGSAPGADAGGRGRRGRRGRRAGSERSAATTGAVRRGRALAGRGPTGPAVRARRRPPRRAASCPRRPRRRASTSEPPPRRARSRPPASRARSACAADERSRVAMAQSGPAGGRAAAGEGRGQALTGAGSGRTMTVSATADDLVRPHLGARGVGADRLRALGLVDADRADLAALLCERRSCGSSGRRSLACRPRRSNAPRRLARSSGEAHPLRRRITYRSICLPSFRVLDDLHADRTPRVHPVTTVQMPYFHR